MSIFIENPKTRHKNLAKVPGSATDIPYDLFMGASMSMPTEQQLEYFDKQYNGIREFVKNIAIGKMRSMIVSGPPGVGKSAAVRSALEEHGDPTAQQYLNGKITALSLYIALYLRRREKSVVVLDDTDNIFKDADGQNILKAAMDTTSARNITWSSSTTLLKAAGAPEAFEFKGGVILITNVGFDGNLKSSVHLRAIKDRSFTLQYGADTVQEKFAMIVYMVKRQGMLNRFDVPPKVQDEILEYVHANLEQMSTLSLRTVVKLAELYRVDSTQWREMALMSLVNQK